MTRDDIPAGMMVVVEPQHRGQGIGTALLERAIRHLDSRSVRAMKLDATPAASDFTLVARRGRKDVPRSEHLCRATGVAVRRPRTGVRM